MCGESRQASQYACKVTIVGDVVILIIFLFRGKTGIVYSRPGNELGSIWKQSGKVCQQIFVK